MQRILLTLFILILLLISCSQNEQNPFYSAFDIPFGLPPFDRIEEDHFLPAYKKGFDEHNKEIAAIVSNTEAPTFENTIVAMEKSGALLDRVHNVFSNLNSAHTNKRLQAIAKEVAPMRSRHYDDILLNENLFARIKAVFEQKAELDLNGEQEMLLEKYYQDFVRHGADLETADKNRLREINERLSLLNLKFGENILKENNRFELVIDNKADLAGLSGAIIQSAKEAAEERGHPGKWVFTLHKPSLIPFLQYSEKRDLREKIFTAYINRGNHGDSLDNKSIVEETVLLRLERANLLGYETHAQYVLEKNMAETPETVYDFLNEFWDNALSKAKAEADLFQDMIDAEGHDFKLRPWDWWYYAEKLKKQKYALDDAELRPYFQLEKVRDGAFATATKLFGITFEEIKDVPKYHPEVKAFEVKDADGGHIGILYTDYFPRPSKRGGAWMNAYRKQSNINGKTVYPVVCNVCNFSKPSGNKPALLSLSEVNTLFHEFGHALHGLLSECTYPRLSGTSVARDFVELPSQIMENWASDPKVMKTYARHYETGEPIPDALIEKIEKAAHFNQGFHYAERLAASFLDMDWHSIREARDFDVLAFEEKSMNRIGLISEIVPRYRSTYYRHIFAGGYSAGYYSYTWAEVLDADAFHYFKKTNIFDPQKAEAFRNYILSAGGTEEPMTLYKKFRGAEPDIEPLLERRGLN